jgi:exonuclease VII large subunit
MPSTADIKALAAQLDTRAVTFFAERADDVHSTNLAPFVTTRLGDHATQVRSAAMELRDIRTALDERKASVSRIASPERDILTTIETRRRSTHEQGKRLRAGIRKDLADHTYNYGRALVRLTGATRDSAWRQLVAHSQLVSDTSARSDEGCRRRLQDARRAMQHACELLAASDPRRRGWVLPTDSAGAVVRSGMKLAIGDRLTLSFHDGAAGAVINKTPKEEDQ